MVKSVAPVKKIDMGICVDIDDFIKALSVLINRVWIHLEAILNILKDESQKGFCV
jgi:hypothetical protein